MVILYVLGVLMFYVFPIGVALFFLSYGEFFGLGMLAIPLIISYVLLFHDRYPTKKDMYSMKQLNYLAGLRNMKVRAIENRDWEEFNRLDALETEFYADNEWSDDGYIIQSGG